MLRNDAEAVPCAVTVKPIKLLGEAAGKGRPPLRSAPPSCDDASAGLTAALGSRSGAATPASGAAGGAHPTGGSGGAGDGGLNGGVHGLAGAHLASARVCAAARPMQPSGAGDVLRARGAAGGRWARMRLGFRDAATCDQHWSWSRPPADCASRFRQISTGRAAMPARLSSP